MMGFTHVVRQLASRSIGTLGLILVLVVVLAAILAPLISTHPEAVWDMSPANRLKPPSRRVAAGHGPHGRRYL